jgi:hypothetical protein
MRPIFALLLCLCVLTAVAGCTTRADKEKNKDYDKPRTLEK